MCVHRTCTIVAHNIAQNRPDSFPPYPPDNHHSSDDVYLREGGKYVTGRYIQSHSARDRTGRVPTGMYETGTHWRNLANTIETSMCGGNGALYQITLTACYMLIVFTELTHKTCNTKVFITAMSEQDQFNVNVTG